MAHGEGGRRFDSCPVAGRHRVAQLGRAPSGSRGCSSVVERLVRNEEVEGSTPFISTAQKSGGKVPAPLSRRRLNMQDAGQHQIVHHPSRETRSNPVVRSAQAWGTDRVMMNDSWGRSFEWQSTILARWPVRVQVPSIPRVVRDNH